MAELEPLHYAVLTRNVVSVEEQLLQQGVDVLARNKDGDTALHMLGYPAPHGKPRSHSTDSRNVDLHSVVNETKIIDRLVSADKRCFTVRDAHGNTPLMRCVKAHDHVEVVRALLEHEQRLAGGTDLDILNDNNESVLDLAFARGRGDFITVISVVTSSVEAW